LSSPRAGGKGGRSFPLSGGGTSLFMRQRREKKTGGGPFYFSCFAHRKKGKPFPITSYRKDREEKGLTAEWRLSSFSADSPEERKGGELYAPSFIRRKRKPMSARCCARKDSLGERKRDLDSYSKEKGGDANGRASRPHKGPLRKRPASLPSRPSP